MKDLEEAVLGHIDNVAVKGRAKSLAEKAQLAEKRVTITIEEGGMQDPPKVFVSVNGVAYAILRGEPVSVPESVVHVLDNAIMTIMVKDPVTNRGTPRRVMRFPYRVSAKAA